MSKSHYALTAVVASALLMQACTDPSGSVTLHPPACIMTPHNSKDEPLTTSDNDFSTLIAALADSQLYTRAQQRTPDEVAFNAKPLRKMEFIVRLTDKNGLPIKNTPVVYSYRKKVKAEGEIPSVSFSEQFVTDEDGYLLFNQSNDKEIFVRGSVNLSTSSSSNTNTSLLGPLGGSSTSGSSVTSGGFAVRVSSETPPIVLEGEYEGYIEVPGAKVGAPDRLLVGSTIGLADAQHKHIQNVNRYVRTGFVSKADSGTNCSGGGCNSSVAEDLLKKGRLVYRSGIDQPFNCTDAQREIPAVLEDGNHIDIVDSSGTSVECAVIEKLQSEKTCDSDWILSVWETHRLEVAL